jgi:FkbM family methyltransferase
VKNAEESSGSAWKAIVRRRTPRALRPVLVRLGRFFDTAPRFPSQEGAFRTLRSLGWAPRTCIDVGAYHGEWAQQFRAVFPEARVLMIEAQTTQEARLQATVAAAPQQLAYEIALLGAEDGREVEFVEMETGSSVFEESSPYPRRRVRKCLTTLDTLLSRHPGFRAAQALKLDTQGYELEVLRGASKLLAHAEVVLLEVSLLAINRGAPSFAEVVAFMQARGFEIFDFCSQIRRRDGVLWQTDLLFVRGDAIANLDAKLTEDNWVRCPEGS